MNARDRSVLTNICEEAGIMEEMLAGYDFDSFICDERTKRAAAMPLINIGELIKLLSFELRAEHNHIPWKDIAGLRDVTAHGYRTLRMDDIWTTAVEDVSRLKKDIEAILSGKAL
jgi:uncharacterized protein with HEPN domain